MNIKDSPVKGYKTDFAGFELDVSKIEMHSTHKRERSTFRIPARCLMPSRTMTERLSPS